VPPLRASSATTPRPTRSSAPLAQIPGGSGQPKPTRTAAPRDQDDTTHLGTGMTTRRASCMNIQACLAPALRAHAAVGTVSAGANGRHRAETRPSTRLRDRGRSRNGNPEEGPGEPRPREAFPQDGSRATARRSRVRWTARQSICTSPTYYPPEGASGHVLASSSPPRAVIETLPRSCHAQPPPSSAQGTIRHPAWRRDFLSSIVD
jgi:hypothetical protein